MNTSTSEEKHGIEWTARMQLDDLDFADDLALQQMQKTTSVAEASVADDRSPETNRSPKDIYLHHSFSIVKRMATELGGVNHLSD
ncbi:unnamed protein product [Schistosoma margrebowiei]|uniref:Uncharacterized protein n=1 Tax=Schistosoma margrebowiei TaxID=48269 RepID=A0A183MK99_9TREM|nr:unnamed protein product [Schistosoma margrebowiei]